MKKINTPTVKVGTDVCHIHRIKLAYEKFGKRFLEKILTTREMKYVISNKKNLIHRLAGLYAAKEALSKVLGTGLNGIYFREIEIVRETSGAPKVRLNKRALIRAKKIGLQNFDVSISHDENFAIAVAAGVIVKF